LLENIFDLSGDASGPVPSQRILIQEDPFYPGRFIDSHLVLCTPVVLGVTIDTEVLDNHSVFWQVEIGIPDPNLAPVDHGQGVLIPIGYAFTVEKACDPDFSPAPVSGPFIGLFLMIMLFCHAGNRAAFLIYLAALRVAALSRHG
jgi:hypothetical protein